MGYALKISSSGERHGGKLGQTLQTGMVNDTFEGSYII